MAYRKNPLNADELRLLAKERFHRQLGASVACASKSDMDQLIEELEIRQIELELQNEHLNAVRAQLESALTQSAELYDFAPVGILTLDRAGRILKLNLAGATLLGGERAHLVGNRFGSFLVHDHVSAFNARLETAMALGEMQECEMTLVRPGQSLAHVEIRIGADPDAQNCQVILMDITERKLLEERLHVSAQRWELALEAAGDGVWDWNVQTGEMHFSRRFAQLLGLAEHECGKHVEDWTSRIHPDDKTQVTADLQDHLAGRASVFLNEHRARCRDGSWKWIHSRGAVVSRSEDGKALRMIGRHIDISTRKHTEEALAASRQFQQAVFDSLSAHIAVLDRNGTIIQTNAAWRKHGADKRYAYAPGFIGANYLDVLDYLTHQDQKIRMAVSEGISSVLSGEQGHFQLQQPFLAPSDKRWFSVHVTPVPDVEGRVVVSHEDVTRLKQTEEENWRLASTDVLTGALSWERFLDVAEQELTQSVRYELALMVLMLDVDDFHGINARHGRPIGDAVLKLLVQILRHALREPDSIGRLGGGKFTVMLRNTPLAGGRALAERIAAMVRSSTVDVGGESIQYTVSIGGACLSDEGSFLALLTLAEAALSRAKCAGRGHMELAPARPRS
jgi:diguanylate cyclase (GGDEF)-like protein/PAS domain S-box-containing protein